MCSSDLTSSFSFAAARAAMKPARVTSAARLNAGALLGNINTMPRRPVVVTTGSTAAAGARTGAAGEAAGAVTSDGVEADAFAGAGDTSSGTVGGTADSTAGGAAGAADVSCAGKTRSKKFLTAPNGLNPSAAPDVDSDVELADVACPKHNAGIVAARPHTSHLRTCLRTITTTPTTTLR